MFLNAWDMARFGYLLLKEGRWQGRALISPDWLRAAATPSHMVRSQPRAWLRTTRGPWP